MMHFFTAAAIQATYLPINWGQIVIVLSSLVVALVALFGMIDKRMKDRQKEMERKIDTTVATLSTILTEKLETKENVAAIRVELARLNERVSSIQQHADVHHSAS